MGIWLHPYTVTWAKLPPDLVRQVPPLEVAESLLDVAARKLGDNVLADACGSILPIVAKSSSNLAA